MAVDVTFYSIPTHASYSYNNGDLYITYDKANEFNATLAILTLQDRTKLNFGIFNTIVFTCNNKNCHKTVFASITKIDNNTLQFNIMGGKDKFLSYTIGEMGETIFTIAQQIKSIFIGRRDSQSYIKDEELMAQAKRVLERFNYLINIILNSSDPMNSASNSLKTIPHLFQSELIEFMNIIGVNEVSIKKQPLINSRL